jgi:hypothetical protein
LLNTTADRGSRFMAIISPADLVLTTTNPVILQEYHEILVDQTTQLKRLPAPGRNEMSGSARGGR